MIEKNKAIERAQRCSIYTHIFFGFVVGYHILDPNKTVSKLAVEFINHYSLTGIIQPKTLEMNYSNFTQNMRAIERSK